jgi:hypothetical protein
MLAIVVKARFVEKQNCLSLRYMEQLSERSECLGDSSMSEQVERQLLLSSDENPTKQHRLARG